MPYRKQRHPEGGQSNVGSENVLREGGGSGARNGQQTKTGSIMRTVDNWHALPKGFEGNFDAVLNGDGPFAGNCYIFKGDSYLKYDWNADQAVSGYPKKIAGNWPGMPAEFCADLDAAINGQGAFAGNCYFFKGDSYVKFDWSKDRAASGYPKKIADGWNLLPDAFQQGLNAAVEGYGHFAGKAYLFKANDYVRYDWKLDRADP
jgi:hypothetical protein